MEMNLTDQKPDFTRISGGAVLIDGMRLFLCKIGM